MKKTVSVDPQLDLALRVEGIRERPQTPHD